MGRGNAKPIEHGFKFHCLADHGYICHFVPTSNQAGPDTVPPVEGLTPTGEIVYHLLTKLPKSRHWIVYLDNFYTTVPLLGRLRHVLKIAACGTARPSSAAFPKDLKMDKKDVYHIFSSMKDMPDISHKEFRLAVAWGLINAGPPPRIPPPASVPRPSVTRNTQLPAGRFSDSAHMPRRSENKKTCYLCRFNHKGEGISKSRPLTRWGCSDCKVPLCLNDKRNCFADMHDPEA
jgi:hypothetical protein